MFGATPVQLDAPRTWHLSGWNRMSEAARLAKLREIVSQYGRDPRIRAKAVEIVRLGGAGQRDYQAQAAALLAWVQEHIYYVNEPGEILQSPDYTMKVAHGDCDDMAILLASFCESLALPWRFALSGMAPGKQKVRYVEGEPVPPGVQWVHIYLRVGWPTFDPKTWVSAEPTLKGVPLGFDVVDQDANQLPEMQAGLSGVGDATAAGDPIAATRDPLHPRTLAAGIVVGVATSVLGALVMEAIRHRSESSRKKNGRKRRR